MKEEQKTISLDVYEEGAVIEALNKIRTEQLENQKPANFVSDLMLKIIQAPAKKTKMGTPRSSAETSRREEVQRSEADTRPKAGATERSLRRRDEAR